MGANVQPIYEWSSTSPVTVDFEAGLGRGVTTRPTYFSKLAEIADRDKHPITKWFRRFFYGGSEDMSTFTFELEPEHTDPKSIVMSWVLHYGHGSPGTDHMRRLHKLLAEPNRLAAAGVDDMYFSEAGWNGYQTAYTLRNPLGMDLLTVINYRDRLVSVGNAGFITDTDPTKIIDRVFNGGMITAGVSPTPLVEIGLPDQLERFGNTVEVVGHFAIPGIVPLGEELGT